MFEEMNREMERVMELVSEELKMIRAGRAKPSMVEDVEVEAYPGTRNKLIELASISAPDPHLLLIKPWDQSVIKEIKKQLAEAEASLNPVIDGEAIRIAIPPLSEERRKELVKLVSQKIESGKNLLREARNAQKRRIDDQEGESGVSEDDIHSWLEHMQERYEEFMDKLEGLGEAKEEELMKI